MNSYLAIATLAVVFAALLGWVIWRLQPDKVSYVNGVVHVKAGGKKESVALSEVSAIKFSYHAVVGFIGVWEFTTNSGRVVCVSSEARGIKETMPQIEKALSGFSLEEFERKFQAGDVEDTLDVWQRA
jgi:hypothetical protein